MITSSSAIEMPRRAFTIQIQPFSSTAATSNLSPAPPVGVFLQRLLQEGVSMQPNDRVIHSLKHNPEGARLAAALQDNSRRPDAQHINQQRKHEDNESGEKT